MSALSTSRYLCLLLEDAGLAPWETAQPFRATGQGAKCWMPFLLLMFYLRYKLLLPPAQISLVLLCAVAKAQMVQDAASGAL